MSIVIEKAVPADASAILGYLKQVGSETDNLTFGAEGVPFTVEAERDYLSSFENSCDGIMLTAKENGKIIGVASLNRLNNRMSHRGDFGVSVLKEYWNKGIGGQLLCSIIDFAKVNSFEIIDLQVRSDNLWAVHLYEKYGFKKLCTYPAFYKMNGEYIDFDYMYLDLR